MKCPKCSANHKRRSGTKCKCGYQFVFVKSVDKITDNRFATAIKSVSADERQLRFVEPDLDGRAVRLERCNRPGHREEL